MNFKTAYTIYKDTISESINKHSLTESIFKKIKNTSARDIESNAEDIFNNSLILDRICFLLTAICKGNKETQEIGMPFHIDKNGKLTSSWYWTTPDGKCQINYIDICFDPKYPTNLYFYTLYKTPRGGGYCSADIIDKDTEKPYCADPERKYTDKWKYSQGEYVDKDILSYICRYLESQFEKINSGRLSFNARSWGLQKYTRSKEDPQRMKKLLTFAFKRYPKKGICDYYRTKYSEVLKS